MGGKLPAESCREDTTVCSFNKVPKSFRCSTDILGKTWRYHLSLSIAIDCGSAHPSQMLISPSFYSLCDSRCWHDSFRMVRNSILPCSTRIGESFEGMKTSAARH